MTSGDHTAEVYTIDSSGKFTLFGGNNELFNVLYDGQIDNYELCSDSIIFCKFFNKNQFFVVCMDGNVYEGVIFERFNQNTEELNSVEVILASKDVNSTNRTEILHLNSEQKELQFTQQLHSQRFNELINSDVKRPYSIFIKNFTKFQTDIVSFDSQGDILALGYEDGSVAVYSPQIQDFYLLQGTNMEITQVEITNQYVLACSPSEFMVFQGNNMIYRAEYPFIYGFYIYEDNIYLNLGEKVILCKFCTSEKHPQISKKDFGMFLKSFENCDYEYNKNLLKQIHEYQMGSVEKILRIDETVIFAGESLDMISKHGGYCPNIKDISKIINQENLIIFSTASGLIYIGDYRGTEFNSIQSETGGVYDMALKQRILYVAGERGIDIFEIICEQKGIGMSFSFISKSF